MHFKQARRSVKYYWYACRAYFINRRGENTLVKDKNVLGFDPKMIKTFSDAELKEKVALQECKSSSKEDPFASLNINTNETEDSYFDVSKIFPKA